MASTKGVSLETATLEDDGFVLIRGALNPMLADELLSHVNEHLTQTISDFARGAIAPEEAFGAIAPPAKMVENRWNLLLPLGGQGKLDKLTHEVVASVVSRACCELESAVGPDAALCDLSALVVDPGALAQRLHFDTRFSDAEESSSDDEENIDTNFENYKASKTRPSSLRTSKRLITGFVALQDVREDMGPTLICPKTTCASVHESIARASGEVETELVLSSYEQLGILCRLSKGDCVLMDSRALHKGTANTSSTRRTLLDFAFVRERCVPSTYCECIKSAVKDRFHLSDFIEGDKKMCDT